MARQSIFIKGNLDVHDSLHSLRVGGKLGWNGINEILRARTPACVVRLRHETCTGFATTLAATGSVPPGLHDHCPPMGPFPLESQFGTALFDTTDAAIVLSVQPDIMVNLIRHRRDGYQMHPYMLNQWTQEQRRWLLEEFESVRPLDPATSMISLISIIERIRQKADVPILVYNFSAAIPGDTVHCYQGLSETLATRIRRFNAALVDVSAETGISIIDVDRIVAAEGARTMKMDMLHLTAPACQLVAAEVVRVLDDYGWLPEQR